MRMEGATAGQQRPWIAEKVLWSPSGKSLMVANPCHRCFSPTERWGERSHRGPLTSQRGPCNPTLVSANPSLCRHKESGDARVMSASITLKLIAKQETQDTDEWKETNGLVSLFIFSFWKWKDRFPSWQWLALMGYPGPAGRVKSLTSASVGPLFIPTCVKFPWEVPKHLGGTFFELLKDAMKGFFWPQVGRIANLLELPRTMEDFWWFKNS